MASSVISPPIKSVEFTGTTNSSGRIAGALSVFGISDGTMILGAYMDKGSYDSRRSVDIGMYGNAGFELIFYQGMSKNAIDSQSVTCTIYYI